MKRFWKALTSPSARYSVGILLLLGIVIGSTSLVAFDVAMHETSTDSFCLSCHELQENIGYEYEGMSHAKNPLGVRVTCSDCHLPKPFVPKMMRKTRAVAEIYHHLRGTIDTPAKFEAHRLEMATRVWADMKESDSRECRDCHQADLFDLEAQSERARDFHRSALAKGQTCIDCHKGVAHKLPEGIEPDHPMQEVRARFEAAYP